MHKLLIRRPCDPRSPAPAAGSTLRHLRCLRSLKLSGCPAVTEAALQSAVLACTQLTLLELPSQVRAVACLPVTPPGVPTHLRGIRLEGGLVESPGRGGGRRWQQARS